MSSSSAGVSELMDAEKKASTVVAEARAARSDRLKAAKAEAGAAVDDLRAARESEHALTTSSESDAKEAHVCRSTSTALTTKRNFWWPTGPRAQDACPTARSTTSVCGGGPCGNREGSAVRPPTQVSLFTTTNNYSRAPPSPTTSAPSCKEGGPVFASSNGSRRTSARRVSPRRTP